MDDPKWRERINERLAALTAGETVQDNRLEDLEDSLSKIGEIEEQITELDRKVNELKALMQPDMLGNGGIISRLKRLERKDEREERAAEYRWRFWTAVAVAIVSITGFAVKEWPAISGRWNTNMEQLTEEKPHLKVKHKRHVVKEADDEPSPTVQE